MHHEREHDEAVPVSAGDGLMAETDALKCFCEAEMEKRALSAKLRGVIRAVRSDKVGQMKRLLDVMRGQDVTCLRVGPEEGDGSADADTCAGKYVYTRKSYSTKQLTPSLIRCALHDAYETICTRDAGGDDEVSELTSRIVEIIQRKRVTEQPVVVLNDKKPRTVKAGDVLHVNDSAVVSAVRSFYVAKQSYDSTVSAHKLLRRQVNFKAAVAMPVVASYLDRTGQKSQLIVMSKNNNQQVLVRRKVDVRRPAIKLSAFKETVFLVLTRLKDTLGGGKIGSGDLERCKDSLIEDIIVHLNEQRPVVQKELINLVLARRAPKRPRVDPGEEEGGEEEGGEEEGGEEEGGEEEGGEEEGGEEGGGEEEGGEEEGGEEEGGEEAGVEE
jgi:hypothetical protein